ncbi:DedA family protein [Streptomyces dubilierae]|uniref:VTT domain-containing protein n=1 Tax=Streptomyces dubilierae TaxID=3075533 RepID=A0ABU2PKU7_9ACTN|nr:VTT domain-containing protein [Streptomyces sp. DSM 41921]MDT0392783.1 VTT domain-containing protein [Streptomyces sp. DSM 41921]
MTTLALGPEWLSPDYLISTFSLPGILLIVFAESGLFAFLPGDSLLFTAGLFVAEGTYITQPLWLVCTLIVLAAVIGDQVGYMIGKFLGPKLFNRPNSKLFKQENLDKAHEFMEKYGPKAIVLARFVPIVRTFAPIVAGAGRMKYRTFLTYNVIGGIAWGTGVTLAGYWLGQIDFIKKNVESILILIVLLSVVPIIIEYLRDRSKKKRAAAEAPAAAQPHPPVMDDATTQLRRITPDDRPAQQPQHRQNGHDGRQHDNRQYSDQQYSDQQYSDQQYSDQQYSDQQYYDQYPQAPGYGQQQPYGRQQPYGTQQGPYNNGY